jgi:hypothetical protein
MWPEPLNRVRRRASSRRRPLHYLCHPSQGRIRCVRMSEFELAELDYELRRESANVVNAERAEAEKPPPQANPAGRESDREKI